jgi:hypothetical protein
LNFGAPMSIMGYDLYSARVSNAGRVLLSQRLFGETGGTAGGETIHLAAANL